MNYKFLLNNVGRFEVVDTRDEIDMSRFVGYTTSTVKKIVTPNQRNYNSLNTPIHNSSTYILTYPDNSLHLFNGSRGDYIPPGYTKVSRGLEDLFSGWDGSKVVRRCRIVPLAPTKLINGSLRSRSSSICVYRRDTPIEGLLVGWNTDMMPSQDGRGYAYIDCLESSGIKCRHSGSRAAISQPLRKEIFEGDTTIRVRSPGALLVLINGVTLQMNEGVWTWTGDPITEDMMLSVVVGDENWVSGVEILND